MYVMTVCICVGTKIQGIGGILSTNPEDSASFARRSLQPHAGSKLASVQGASQLRWPENRSGLPDGLSFPTPLDSRQARRLWAPHRRHRMSYVVDLHSMVVIRALLVTFWLRNMGSSRNPLAGFPVCKAECTEMRFFRGTRGVTGEADGSPK